MNYHSKLDDGHLAGLARVTHEVRAVVRGHLPHAHPALVDEAVAAALAVVDNVGKSNRLHLAVDDVWRRIWADLQTAEQVPTVQAMTDDVIEAINRVLYLMDREHGDRGAMKLSSLRYVAAGLAGAVVVAWLGLTDDVRSIVANAPAAFGTLFGG